MDSFLTIRRASEPKKKLRPPPPVGCSGPATDSVDFRLFLHGILAQRCRTNPRYTLRSFARRLEIDHSSLSQILRGKRALTIKTISKLGQRLNLTPAQMEKYTAHARSGGEVQGPEVRCRELSLDAFQVIADWYHYAIFELVTVRDFRPDHRWIARHLGLTVSETNVAIERLKRLGLITVASDGAWRQGVSFVTTTGNHFTAVAFRRLQHHVLQMAQNALEEIPFDVRDQSSMTMAINSGRIPEAKERIRRFRRDLHDFLQADEERDAVFQLGISLYPLTKLPTKG